MRYVAALALALTCVTGCVAGGQVGPEELDSSENGPFTPDAGSMSDGSIQDASSPDALIVTEEGNLCADGLDNDHDGLIDKTGPGRSESLPPEGDPDCDAFCYPDIPCMMADESIGVCSPETFRCEIDTDVDGFADIHDNCPRTKNIHQTDEDRNLIGDGCQGSHTFGWVLDEGHGSGFVQAANNEWAIIATTDDPVPVNVDSVYVWVACMTLSGKLTTSVGPHLLLEEVIAPATHLEVEVIVSLDESTTCQWEAYGACNQELPPDDHADIPEQPCWESVVNSQATRQIYLIGRPTSEGIPLLTPEMTRDSGPLAPDIFGSFDGPDDHAYKDL